MSVVRMLGVGRVVATVESPAVVADGVAVVAGAGHAVRVPGQTQSSQGEGYGGAQLLAKSFCRGKSLEVNNKNLGKTIEGISLSTLPPCLTGLAGLKSEVKLRKMRWSRLTYRHLVTVQGLLLSEGIKTFVE